MITIPGSIQIVVLFQLLEMEKRQNTLCCISKICDKHKANGFIFMSVPRYGRIFFFSFYDMLEIDIVQ